MCSHLEGRSDSYRVILFLITSLSTSILNSLKHPSLIFHILLIYNLTLSFPLFISLSLSLPPSLSLSLSLSLPLSLSPSLSLFSYISHAHKLLIHKRGASHTFIDIHTPLIFHRRLSLSLSLSLSPSLSPSLPLSVFRFCSPCDVHHPPKANIVCEVEFHSKMNEKVNRR